MKKYLGFVCLLAAVILVTSCEEDEGKLPNIAFKTGTNYTSADASVGQGETILIGINASKSESKDVLITFDAAMAFDGAAASSFLTETLNGSDGDSYSRDVQVTTRNQAGTETYTFTVINRDGLKNSVTLTLTVN